MSNRVKIVVDASYILSFLFPDENFIDEIPGKMFAPQLLDYEIANALRSAVIRKRISQELAIKLLEEYQTFPITKKTVDFSKVLELSIKSQISTYDASYLVLAKDLDLELLTFDTQLKKIAAQKHASR
jgi:predicted nucleic acid-binding protein